MSMSDELKTDVYLIYGISIFFKNIYIIFMHESFLINKDFSNYAGRTFVKVEPAGGAS